MIEKEDILKECIKSLNDSQFLVDIKTKNSNEFIVYVDDYNGLNIEDCKRINKNICSAFDRDVEDFSLEVSSPGLEKPFRVKQQYIKNTGNTIEVLYKDGEKVKGKISEVNDDFVVLEIVKNSKKKSPEPKEPEKERINFKDIKTAKIVLMF